MTGTHDLRNRVAAYYRGGHSMRETATRFGITFPEVRRILRRDCPGDIRPRHRPSRPQKAEAEYRRARAAERTRQNMEIERSWPEREAFR